MSFEDKETALKCFELAKTAINEEDFAKAQRLLKKAIRIHRLDCIEELLNVVEDTMAAKEDGKTFRRITLYSSNSNDSGSSGDAEKCVDLAQTALQAGDLVKAKRMLLKAERLCPSVRAKALLKRISVATNGRDQVNGESPPKTPEKKTEKVEKVERKEPTPVFKPRVRADPTTEQLAAIRQVQNASNDHEMFGMNRSASIRQLKQAHKRLIRLLHTDKNSAPGAKEAFMAITSAAQRLKIK